MKYNVSFLRYMYSVLDKCYVGIKSDIRRLYWVSDSV